MFKVYNGAEEVAEKKLIKKYDEKEILTHNTRDYDLFSMIDENREINRGHVERLKKIFLESGNITLVQPILVNERYQIIDGQHRYTACKELEIPVYFRKVMNLKIEDARLMNTSQRQWDINDWAKSYALSGMPFYVRYLQIREQFEFGHTVLLWYLADNQDNKLLFREFREGNFTIVDEDQKIADLKFLEAFLDLCKTKGNRDIAIALHNIMKNPEFSRKRMLSKAEHFGETNMRAYSGIKEYMRALEDLYNFRNNLPNRERLF